MKFYYGIASVAMFICAGLSAWKGTLRFELLYLALFYANFKLFLKAMED